MEPGTQVKCQNCGEWMPIHEIYKNPIKCRCGHTIYKGMPEREKRHQGNPNWKKGLPRPKKTISYFSDADLLKCFEKSIQANGYLGKEYDRRNPWWCSTPCNSSERCRNLIEVNRK